MALLLSWKLWLSSRFYPLTPIFPFLKPPPFPLDWALFIGLLLAAAVIVAVRAPCKWISVFAGLAVFVACFDQSRWQPWFYQYLLMLLAIGFGLYGKVPDRALNTCRLILVCTYFWSGLQKLNTGFAGDVFPWMAEPLTKFLPAPVQVLVASLGSAAPFVETGIGIGLLFPALRTLAVGCAFLMHTFILAGIGPLGQNANNVVWPWNVVMMACLILLFWHTSDVSWKSILWVGHSRFHTLVLMLVGIAPLLCFFNMWDSYLSSAMYAGNKNYGSLYITDSVFDKLPGVVQDITTEESSNVNEIDIPEWSYAELNVPAYAEIRIYKNVAATVCRFAEKPSDVKLVIKGKVALVNSNKTYTYDCGTL